MASINWGSILSKVNSYTNSSKGKAEVQEAVDRYMLGSIAVSTTGKGQKPPSVAADKFIDVLKDTINSHSGSSPSAGELGSTAISALSNLQHGTPYKVGDKYYIDISFSSDLHRDSLDPERYGGIENIAALLNSGYTAGHRVYGVWSGHTSEPIASLQSRGGAHFMEEAVRNFMSGHAAEFGVLDIEIAEIYK